MVEREDFRDLGQNIKEKKSVPVVRGGELKRQEGVREEEDRKIEEDKKADDTCSM